MRAVDAVAGSAAYLVAGGVRGFGGSPPGSDHPVGAESQSHESRRRRRHHEQVDHLAPAAAHGAGDLSIIRAVAAAVLSGHDRLPLRHSDLQLLLHGAGLHGARGDALQRLRPCADEQLRRFRRVGLGAQRLQPQHPRSAPADLFHRRHHASLPSAQRLLRAEPHATLPLHLRPGAADLPGARRQRRKSELRAQRPSVPGRLLGFDKQLHSHVRTTILS